MKRLCALTLFAATVAGCSNVELQGIVRDQSTGDPLPGATVRVGEDETETDYRGFYELEVDEEEAREIMVDKTGYESFSQPVELTGIDEVIQDVELNPSLPMSEQDGGLMAPTPQEGQLSPGGVNQGSTEITPPPTTAPADEGTQNQQQGTMSDEFDTGAQNNLQKGRQGGMMRGWLGGSYKGTGGPGGPR
jgi:hypothetical protein